MSFKMVLLPPGLVPGWPETLRDAVPGIEVRMYEDPADAVEDIVDADAVHGTLPPALFVHARKLRWIQAARAGLGGAWFHERLVQSDVVVTNVRGIYNDHIGHHVMAMLLALARRLDRYHLEQQRGSWKRLEPHVHLPDATVLIVGVGGIGAETARLCAAFGMRVVGVDPRTDGVPPGMQALHRPERLDELLPEADFVVLTTPETPQTIGLMDAARFGRMRPTAFFINVGRGACVVLDDLVRALQRGSIAGAGLDVTGLEPLPADHPLWTAPGVLITPHVAIHGASYLDERRTEILVANCQRFARGEPLLNVVDKTAWY